MPAKGALPGWDIRKLWLSGRGRLAVQCLALRANWGPQRKVKRQSSKRKSKDTRALHSEKAVNDALRLVIELSKVGSGKRA